jgi:hypothetical protein
MENKRRSAVRRLIDNGRARKVGLVRLWAEGVTVAGKLSGMRGEWGERIKPGVDR